MASLTSLARTGRARRSRQLIAAALLAGAWAAATAPDTVAEDPDVPVGMAMSGAAAEGVSEVHIALGTPTQIGQGHGGTCHRSEIPYTDIHHLDLSRIGDVEHPIVVSGTLTISVEGVDALSTEDVEIAFEARQEVVFSSTPFPDTHRSQAAHVTWTYRFHDGPGYVVAPGSEERSFTSVVAASLPAEPCPYVDGEEAITLRVGQALEADVLTYDEKYTLVDGTLPPGVALTPVGARGYSTATVRSFTGTPTTAGTYPATVRTCPLVDLGDPICATTRWTIAVQGDARPTTTATTAPATTTSQASVDDEPVSPPADAPDQAATGLEVQEARSRDGQGWLVAGAGAALMVLGGSIAALRRRKRAA